MSRGGNEKEEQEERAFDLEDHCSGQLVYPDSGGRKGRRGRSWGWVGKVPAWAVGYTDLGFISASTFALSSVTLDTFLFLSLRIFICKMES